MLKQRRLSRRGRRGRHGPRLGDGSKQSTTTARDPELVADMLSGSDGSETTASGGVSEGAAEDATEAARLAGEEVDAGEEAAAAEEFAAAAKRGAVEEAAEAAESFEAAVEGPMQFYIGDESEEEQTVQKAERGAAEDAAKEVARFAAVEAAAKEEEAAATAGCAAAGWTQRMTTRLSPGSAGEYRGGRMEERTAQYDRLVADSPPRMRPDDARGDASLEEAAVRRALAGPVATRGTHR